MTHGLFFIADSQYRELTTESCQITGGPSAIAVCDDGTYLQFRCSFHCLFSKEGRYIVTVFVQRDTDIILFQFIFFSLGRDLGHCLDCIYRIFAISSLTAQHQSIRTIVDCIRDIGHFRAGRTRIVDHGMKHLSRNDHRFLCQDTFADQHTLDTRNTFLRHFDTQVTTGYHHAVRHFKNLVDVVHPFLILNLGNNPDITIVSIQNFTDIKYVLTVAHERVSDEIDILFNRVKYIVTVFLCQ